MSKSTWGEQQVEDILKFTRICICQNPRKASSRSRIFLKSLVYLWMCVFIYLWVSRLLAKRKTIQTWNLEHTLPLTLSKNRFLVFSIKSPWRPLDSKNCPVTWIFHISPRLPCLEFFLIKIQSKILRHGIWYSLCKPSKEYKEFSV